VNNQIERECPNCGVIYNADPARLKHGRQTTCSRVCSYQFRAALQQNGSEQTCPVCGESFYRSPAQIKAKHGVSACSAECAYKVRKRVVTVPYAPARPYDRQAAAAKAWEVRRANPKPYPESARVKARAQLADNLDKLGGVSKFERKAAEVYRDLGFSIDTSCVARNTDGTFYAVYDIVIPARRIIVECHGTYWHGGRWTWDDANAAQLKNLRYEERKNAFARSQGFEVRILWEHHFRKDPVGAALAVVR
jgi:G:T-mismatch repair DNA endonuclease (very short patch repair protein)